MTDYSPDVVAAYNQYVEDLVAEKAEGATHEDFNQEVEESVADFEDLLDTAQEFLRYGFTPMAVCSLVQNELAPLDIRDLAAVVSAYVTHTATEAFVEEETNGISGS